MDQNELMLGNLVEYKGVAYSVCGITNECAILQDAITNKSVPFNELMPVGLTEDYFLKFGFEFKKTEKSNSYSKSNFRANFVTDGRFKGKMFLVYVNRINWEKCDVCLYVHKFQNLYMALIGESLTFKN